VTELLTQVVWWLLAATAVIGALAVVFTKDVMRMAIGLAAFLVAVAGLFLFYALPFLAVVQVFVYVGGVLVLFLFAIMLVHRAEEGRPGLESRHDIGSIALAVGIVVLVVMALRPLREATVVDPTSSGTAALAEMLLGPMLPHFEAAGVLLLLALVAVIVVVGGDDE